MARRGKRKPFRTSPPQASPDLRDWRQFLATLPVQLRPAARHFICTKPPCLLCHGPFHAVGVFLPYRPQQWGIAPGCMGACVYSLCAECVALPDRGDRAEAVLWSERVQAVAQQAAQWN
jgi:hypothetical protein